MTSKRAQAVRAVTGKLFKLTDAKSANAFKARRKLHVLAKLLPTAGGVQVTRDRIDGLEVEWLKPSNAPEDKLIMYLHGGAFITGSCTTHRPFVSHLARAAGVRAVMPEYRLAPEHPYPAAIDDAVRTYRYLISNGLMPEDIVFAGDSAGANLALATMLKLRDAGDPLPAAACLLSPWLDLAATGETMTSNAENDPWFRPEDIRYVAGYYCNADQITEPLASPVYADVGGLPPIFIQVGSDEVLLSDSTRLADKVRASDGEVEIEIWQGMWHVFQVFVGVMPESGEAIRKIGDYIQRVFAKSD
jgi:monoterpene epsilon-lactone hydrolase